MPVGMNHLPPLPKSGYDIPSKITYFYATHKLQVSFLSCCILLISLSLAKEAWFYPFPTTKKAQNG